ncbi:hypothetical protein CA54_10580 [Symmachiella macrocystis]|uniref:Bacterial type II secretion system protein G n=1 Tax=Symmachiella macrocystis TaxID=2527985 RepID=A0A5C6BJN5_9PLAN|nr:hypothetical protein [Symmachiella macrocystis]TWU12235.1 hypothetical protein CA54_10580 [Symmachiella macrocystis]
MDAPPKRSSWSVGKMLLFAVGALLIGTLAILGVSWYSAHAALEEKLAALRAEGLPTNAAELADFYKVRDDVPDTTDVWVDILDKLPTPYSALSEPMKQIPIIGQGAMPIPPPGTEWAQLEAVEEFLVQYESQLQAARGEAGSNGQVRFPIDFSTNPYMLDLNSSEQRQVARLLQLDAHVAAHCGDDTRALLDIRAIFAQSDALRGEPILISQLVRFAIRSLGCGVTGELMPYCDWSDDDLAALQASIRIAHPDEEMARAMDGERAFSLMGLDLMTWGPLRVRNKLTAIEYFEHVLKAFEGTPADSLIIADEIDQRISEIEENDSLLGLDRPFLLIAPPFAEVIKAAVRSIARQRCYNAGIAAQRYRVQRGQFPKALSDLNQEFLGPVGESATSLIDPFDGKPLRYRQDDKRIIIYSIADDAVDDSGDRAGNTDGLSLQDIGIVLPK